jgi:hypothetical protein
MKYSAFALAAVAAAGAAAGNPNWVPLNSTQSKVMQGQIPAAQQPQAPTPVAAVPQSTPSDPRSRSQTNQAGRLLPAGTMVSLSPLQEISSQHMREGDRFSFLVVQDVIDNGVVVIPRGSNATGVVTAQTGRAIGGKSGKFDISFESVVANGVRFPLTGMAREEGKGNTVGALLGIIFISGRSATLLPGQVVTAFTSMNTAY